MKIAVLMSTYNGEKYIRDQIESIINQEGEFDIHLLVRDDGSSDSTPQILEEYKAQGKLEWYTGENLKPAHSFLTLLQKSTGYDFYAFADQDDYWEKDKIASAINLIQDSKVPTLYFSNAELVDAELKSLGQVVYKHMPKIDFCTITCAGGLLGCTMVFNQLLALLIQERRLPDKIILHDYYMGVVCAAMNGKVVYDSVPHMKYRQHANNVVGMAHGKWQKICNRFSDIRTKTEVSIAEQAQTMLDMFGKELPQEHRKWLIRLSTYRNNIFSRIGMACTRKTKYISYNMSFKFRMTLLLGNR